MNLTNILHYVGFAAAYRFFRWLPPVRRCLAGDPFYSPLQHPRHCTSFAAIIRHGREQYGAAAALLADALLSLPGFVLLLAVNLLILRFAAHPWLAAGLQTAAALYCLFSFGPQRPFAALEWLKVLYLLFSLFTHACWPITYLILVCFENLV